MKSDPPFPELGDNPQILRCEKMSIAGDLCVRIAKYLHSSECVVKKVSFCNHSVGKSEALLLVRALFENKTVKLLDFNSNGLDGDVGNLVAELIRTNKSVRVMNFANNNLGPSGVHAIAKALMSNRTLQCLDLTRNNAESGAEAFGEAVATNTSLVALCLGENKCQDNVAKSLSVGLTSNRTLMELDLSRNNIGPIGGLALLQTLKDGHPSLRTLRVNSNGLPVDVETKLHTINKSDASVPWSVLRGEEDSNPTFPENDDQLEFETSLEKELQRMRALSPPTARSRPPHRPPLSPTGRKPKHNHWAVADEEVDAVIDLRSPPQSNGGGMNDSYVSSVSGSSEDEKLEFPSPDSNTSPEKQAPGGIVMVEEAIDLRTVTAVPKVEDVIAPKKSLPEKVNKSGSRRRGSNSSHLDVNGGVGGAAGVRDVVNEEVIELLLHQNQNLEQRVNWAESKIMEQQEVISSLIAEIGKMRKFVFDKLGQKEK